MMRDTRHLGSVVAVNYAKGSFINDDEVQEGFWAAYDRSRTCVDCMKRPRFIATTAEAAIAGVLAAPDCGCLRGEGIGEGAL